MKNKTDSKEREDFAALVDAYAEAYHVCGDHSYSEKTAAARAALLRAIEIKGFDAADMATASAQGFRDGVASLAASAGSEPVAFLVYTEEGDPDMVFLDQSDAQQYLEDHERPTPLYTHPSPPGGMVMVPREPTMAMRIAAKTADMNHTNLSDWMVTDWPEFKRIWDAMLKAAPPTSSADSRKGE